MAANRASKNLFFAKLIHDAEETVLKRDIAQTPLVAIVVALFLDRLNFVSFINSVVRWDEKQWQVSPGNLAKSIVLTPFLSKGARIPLYCIYENFQSVDMSLLFQDRVKSEWLTRDAFACLLDRVYEAGCEQLFTNIALKVYSVFKIPFKSIFHGDTTSIVLYGEYEGYESNPDGPATPAHGYSKDGKPNLKQILIGMVTDTFGIPLSITVRDGNQNDSKWNNTIIDSLADLLKTATGGVTYIADSKLTTGPNIKKLLEHGFQFLTVCPANFEKKLAESVRRSAYLNNVWTSIGTYREPRTVTLAQYEVQEFLKLACGTSCRLLVFRSSETKKDASKALDKEKTDVMALIKTSTSKEFSCQADALKEIKALEKSLKNRVWTAVFTLSTKEIVSEKRGRGRPSKNAKPLPTLTIWMILADELIVRQEKYDLFRWRAESFVLFTNVMDDDATAVEILRLYKEQKTVEDNFSVLKRPAMVDTIFLHLPRRIVALVTLLSFALLIQVVIRILVQRNLDAMEVKPGIDHDGKPIARMGLKKIIRFLGYYSIISEDGEQYCICKTKKHRPYLTTWLNLLEIEF